MQSGNTASGDFEKEEHSSKERHNVGTNPYFRGDKEIIE
jgi:hypothetical protein